MRKLKYVFLSICLVLIFIIIKPSSADMGPKPSIYITIKGIEGDYVAAFAASYASGPNFDYESYKEGSYGYLEYNPIMEYKDDEGFKWITRYYKCKDKTDISFTYYAPEVFKLVIYKDGKLYSVTESIKKYAYAAYYTIDFNENIITENNIIEYEINNSYNYVKEILNLISRIVLTLLIEFALFFLFRLYTKHNFKVVLITNLITQILLNIILNLKYYYNGLLSAYAILILLEIGILIIETIIYKLFLKDKNKVLITIYPIIANISSFIVGLLIFNML